MMDTYYGHVDINSIIRENIQLKKDTANLNETAIQLKKEQKIQIKSILKQNEMLKEQIKTMNEKYQKLIEEINKIKEDKRDNKSNKKQKIRHESVERMETENTTGKQKEKTKNINPQTTENETPKNNLNINKTHNTTNTQTTKITIENKQQQKTNTQHTTKTTKQTKTVPIIIRDIKNWPALNKELKSNYNIENTKKVGLGIQLTPNTPTDHRNITRHLTNKNIDYHTYLLPEERDLNVIVKGLPKEIPIEEIKEDIEDMGFNVKECHRMTIGFKKIHTSMIKCRLAREDTEIYKQTEILGIRVHIEPQIASKTDNYTPQCKRCQKFGHSESRCRATPQCNRCEGKHLYTECTKPKTSKNFCANCKGEHATNYGKCPKNPKNIQKTQETQQQKQRKIPIKPIQKNISFSEMIKKTNTQTPQKTTPQTQTQKPKTLNTELPPNDLFSQSFEEIESKVRFYYAMVNKYRDSPK